MVKSIRIVLVVVLCCFIKSVIGQSFIQKASAENVDRNRRDNFGQVVDINGNYAIVGTNQEDDNVFNQDSLLSAGGAYIFEKDTSGKWQRKQKLVASDRAAEDFFATSVCIQGDYAFVGAVGQQHDTAGNDPKGEAGMVYVFKRDHNNKWNEVQKLVASDRDVDDWFGASVSVSGSYLAVGASQEDHNANGSNALNNAGSVYIFKYNTNNNKWEQEQKITSSDRGTDDRFGSAVRLKDEYLAVGAPWEKHNVNGGNTLTRAGSVYVFKVDNLGKWNQVRKIVATNRTADSQFGFSLALSTSQTIVVGAYGHKLDTAGNNSLLLAGMAYIYERDGTAWNEVKKIQGDNREAQAQLGISVAIRGNVALIGSRASYDENGLNFIGNAGQVLTFIKNKQGKWAKTQVTVAKDRNGPDAFGTSVAFEGDNIIVGAPWDDDDFESKNNVGNAGSVYFYKISCVQPTKPVLSASNIVACKGSAVKIKVSGKLNDAEAWYWSEDSCDGDVVHKGDSLLIPLALKNKTYYVTAGGGCSKSDTCDTVSVVVKPISASTNTFTICANDSLKVGGKYYKVTGSYKDTLVAYNGCDSFLTTHLNVLPVSKRTQNISLCFGESYTINAKKYTATGTYYDTLTAQNGCDSVITTNLTIKPQIVNSISATLCVGKSFTVGSSHYTQPGTYYDTLTSQNGCDSIVTSILSFTPALTSQQNRTICYGQTFKIGNSTYSQSGTYYDTLKAFSGCDSIVTTVLNILPLNTTTQSPTICFGEGFNVGNSTYNQAGTYVDTLVAFSGCDSIVETILTVNTVNTQVSISKTTLSAQATSGQYQWLNCGNNYAIIVGEVANSYTAIQNGDYAVEVTQNNCVDTSQCISINTVSVAEIALKNEISIYPNPSTGIVFIEHNFEEPFTVNIYNQGLQKVIDKAYLSGEKPSINLSQFPSGVYVLEIKGAKKAQYKKVVVIR